MNKKIVWVIVWFLGGLLALAGSAYAQDVPVKRVEKTVTIGSKQFYMHHVSPGETLEAIAKAYHVTVDEIAAYNPELKRGGFQAKMVIGIPVVQETEDRSRETEDGSRETEDRSQETEDGSRETEDGSRETEDRSQETEDRSRETEGRRQETEDEVMERPVPSTIRDTIVEVGGKRYVMHYVKPGETIWGLSRAFHVTEADIVSKNPEVKEGLKAGMVIGIPVVQETEDRRQETEDRSRETEDGSQETEDRRQETEDGSQEIEDGSREIEDRRQETEDRSQETERPSVVVVPEVTTPARVTTPPVSDDDEYGDGYVIHTVKKAEKTRALAEAWNVSLEEFRQLNPSVGSRVFVGQKVLIPYREAPSVAPVVEDPLTEEQPVAEDPVAVFPETEPAGENLTEPIEEPENPSGKLLYSDEVPLDCFTATSLGDHTCHVALLVPLYLNDVDRIDTSRDRAEKTKKSRAMRFLQFYEGFMMAVDSLTEHKGLHLDLTVIDVSEDTSGAEAAVEKLRDKEVDLIIGPFFSKSFAIVQDYAASRDILVVNPLSERESVVADASNVLKLKPGMQSMVTELRDLLRFRYPKAKVTLMTPSNTKDTLMVQALEQMLSASVPQEVQLTNLEMLELISKESQRRKMGKRLLSNLEVEGQIFSTKALEAHPDEVTVFQNPFHHINYSDNEIKDFKEALSSARENVLIAYGNDLVFATKILNNINKSAQKYPITLIGLPQWGSFENLLVQNLLNMNAIYFDDHFVDYNDSTVLQFVDDFRSKYDSEPGDFAFEGFDVGWYFLNALMKYGPHSVDCLPYYHLPLLHSNYYFNKCRTRDGLENRYWNIYQYDCHAVELKPVLIHGAKEE